MSQSLYIAAVEPRSGKAVAALGVMELLSKRIRAVGYFRPVISPGDKPDNNLRLIHSRYQLSLPYEDMYAYTHDEAQALSAEKGDEALIKGILAKYKSLEEKCRFVLCEGTDFTGISSAFEFGFNAEVAKNLGCPLLVMVNGRSRTTAQTAQAVLAAQDAFSSKGCTIAATIINRVSPETASKIVERLKSVSSTVKPVYALPETPSLARPTVGEIADALGAQILYGEAAGLNRDVGDFKVAAMNLANFLNFVAADDLIITPGDRTDVILGSMATVVSDTYPHIAGLLLTGGLPMEPQVLRLIHGAAEKVPTVVAQVDTDTYSTAMNAGRVQPALTPENERKIASALGLFEAHVDLDELESRIQLVRSTRKTPIMFEYELIERAQADRQHIVLPEGTDERILRAAEILLYRGVADLTLLGDSKEIQSRIGVLGLALEGARIIDPEKSDRLEEFVGAYYNLRKHKDISREMAQDSMTDVNYFGTMMVHEGDADGMVSGAAHTTAETIRPALQIIRARPGVSVVSSVFLMCLADRVLVYGDCAVNPDPDAEQLADIAVSSADTARMYGIEPRVALCSYSTGASGKGKDVEKVRTATRLARERRPDLLIEGPIQYDAAVDAGVAKSKLPDSQVAGRATVFIFPDLNTGNNLYKAVQRSANAVAVGPVLQGLNKPVNDLSRGCTVPDIVNTVAITAIQAQGRSYSQVW